MSRTTKKPYRKSRAIDASCRSHGGCPYCLGNHRHGTNKRLADAKEKVVEMAERWGNTEVGDDVTELAADLGLSMALVDLRDAKAGKQQSDLVKGCIDLLAPAPPSASLPGTLPQRGEEGGGT